MKKLYGSIEINKNLEEGGKTVKKYIDYYKLKDEKYGFEIIKKNDLKQNVQRTNINDITDNESKIDNFLNILVDLEVTPDKDDVIEDLVKKHIKKS